MLTNIHPSTYHDESLPSMNESLGFFFHIIDDIYWLGVLAADSCQWIIIKSSNTECKFLINCSLLTNIMYHWPINVYHLYEILTSWCQWSDLNINMDIDSECPPW